MRMNAKRNEMFILMSRSKLSNMALKELKSYLVTNFLNSLLFSIKKKKENIFDNYKIENNFLFLEIKNGFFV